MFYFTYSFCTRNLCSFCFLEKMKLEDDKMRFLWQMHRSTNVLLLLEIWGKYIERDCVVNSCHLYVLNLCVSIF